MKIELMDCEENKIAYGTCRNRPIFLDALPRTVSSRLSTFVECYEDSEDAIWPTTHARKKYIKTKTEDEKEKENKSGAAGSILLLNLPYFISYFLSLYLLFTSLRSVFIIGKSILNFITPN
ncbi:hypothetical protein KQX54_021651 [Cotesia glomerata]|uniref:Uncharacterized protein n=1 Tax=Cotesia glomerata TaxID=32391 RepID=A0AAV7J9C9_COTGL|nr:hypothetical protein KQX54_021651 [Cotesia glomerata]